MSKIVLRNAQVKVNSVDLSDHISKVTLQTTFNLVDVTAFGARYKEILQGLGDATIVCDFFQDFNPASVDATLWPLSQSGTPFPVVVCGDDTIPVSGTNPTYSMTAILGNYDPLDGSVGTASTTSVTFANASQSGVVRGTV